MAAVEASMEAELAAGRHAESVPELQRLAAEYPLRERLHAQLMLALYRSGRQADALEAYQRVRHGCWSINSGSSLDPSCTRLSGRS